MKSNLLCTFVHRNDLGIVLEYIQKEYELDSNKIFVLSNANKPDQYYCTFNVLGQYELTSNTILIHRKSETNTLYTINALNTLIKLINNGVLDMSIQIPWENYHNMMILDNEGQLDRIPLELKKVYRIKQN